MTPHLVAAHSPGVQVTTGRRPAEADLEARQVGGGEVEVGDLAGWSDVSVGAGGPHDVERRLGVIPGELTRPPTLSSTKAAPTASAGLLCPPGRSVDGGLLRVLHGDLDAVVAGVPSKDWDEGRVDSVPPGDVRAGQAGVPETEADVPARAGDVSCPDSSDPEWTWW